MSLISTIGVASPDMAYDYYASLSSNINAYVEPGFEVVGVESKYFDNDEIALIMELKYV